MQRLDAETADRWLARVGPSLPHRQLVWFVWLCGLGAWVESSDASWLVMLACTGAAFIQLGVPRIGWVIGVGSGVAALVGEPDAFVRVAWVVLAVACLVLLMWNGISRRRQRAIFRNPTTSNPAVGGQDADGLATDGLSVRVAIDDESGRLGLFADDGDHHGIRTDVGHGGHGSEAQVVAFVGVDTAAEQATASAGCCSRATLIGEFVVGSRVQIITPSGRLPISGRIRARRRNEIFEPQCKPAQRAVEPGTPVDIPPLPWAPKLASDHSRLVWLSLAMVGVVGLANAVDWAIGGDSRIGGTFQLLALAYLPLPVIRYLCRRVVLDRESLRIRGIMTERAVPWSRIRSISRRSNGEIILDLGGRTRTLAFDHGNGKPSSRYITQVMQTLRAEAPEHKPAEASRLFWGAYAAAAYAACLVVAATAYLTS